MKRLLAYLFIVLGLGLMLNVSAHAYVLEACVQNPKFDSNLKKKDLTVTVSYSSSPFKKIKKNKNNCEYFTGSKHKQFKNALAYNVKQSTRFRVKWYPKGWDWKGKTYYSNYEYILKSWGLESKIYIPEKPKNQIAKVEPSQTQKVVDKYLCILDNLKEKPSDISIPINQLLKVVTLKSSQQSNCTLKFYKSKNKKLYSRIKGSAYGRNDGNVTNWYISYKAINKIFDEQKVQIARFVTDNSEN